eukprot:gb/GECG01016792.1/.p1 GENE.gb/GECG01016792.1/~~gb/GECG01016792.1/.p1  ORF type:complete len:2228 (+),score=336.86 gb/GECG01016792.1/:1-6684(+)
MTDEILRNRQYEYGQNANLVLQAERDSSRLREPTGEPESLRDKPMGKMGDKVAKEKPQELEQKKKRPKKKRQREEVEQDNSRRKGKRTGGVLFSDDSTNPLTSEGTSGVDTNFYQPKTEETRSVYERLLSFIQKYLGDLPHDYLAGAADDILGSLKSDNLSDKERQKEVESVLSSKVGSDEFNKLVNMGKSITDFTVSDTSKQEASDEEGVDDEMGVAVVFDEESEEEESELDEIPEGESDEEDEGEEATTGTGLAAGDDEEEEETEEGEDHGISPAEIDAQWLQRQLNEYYKDSMVTSQLSKDIIQILQQRTEPRSVENSLVSLLGTDKFELIRLLVKNRATVMYVTRLKQAQTEQEQQEIEGEMLNDEEGADILSKIKQKQSAENWAADRTGKITSLVKEEARKLGKSRGAVAHQEDEENDDVVMNGTAKKELRPQRTVDLESLSFSKGGHLMSNNTCELPKNSWRAQKKGYEEVHVPAKDPTPFAEGEQQIAIKDLPEWAQPAFSGMQKLNRVQSKICKSALESSENLLLCAPTGAGKTNVAILSMLRTLQNYQRSDGTFDLTKFKIVYIAPMKALVQELVQNFSARLTEHYGLNVRELSGDVSLTKAEIADTHIIVTTPEKWDIITRKAGDRTYTQLVRLMIFDEIHLLHDERGAVLENLVARTLRHVESTQELIRMVGLSATLPNYWDVAAFLRVRPSSGLYFFDNSFRPCPLMQQYIGVTEKKPMKRLALMNDICYEKVLEAAGKTQMLIFVHSRKETAKTAKFLRDKAVEQDQLAMFVGEDTATRKILQEQAEQYVHNGDLKDMLPNGFAIHHAGMHREDRTLVEDLFAEKHIQVLVSTATLAWGVNLPAHTVIIKGTQVYSPERGCWTELSQLDVQQMLGRAGRPQYDTFGEGIILTSHSELQYYLSLMNEQLPIESQMMKRLADSINAEVVLGTISNLQEAAEWIGYTYLYVRMLREPSLYGIDTSVLENDKLLLQHRLDLAHSAAVLLDKHYLIRYDRRSGAFQTTALGRVAAHYYVVHPTIATLNEHLKPTLSDIEIFRVFSLSHEFRNIVIRQEEKEELRKLIERVPIPIKESMEEPSAKVNVLLQAYISRLRMEGFALVADMVYVQQSAVRLLRAVFEVALRRGWAALADKVLTLCKMVDKRMWLSQTPLRQFTRGVGREGKQGLPDDVLRKIEKKDIPWERYFDLTKEDLGELVKMPKLGKTLFRLVHSFPKVELQAHVQPVTRSTIKVELTITPDFNWDSRIHGASETFWIIVEDTDGEQIMHFDEFVLKQRYAAEDHVVSFTVSLTDPMPPQYFIRVVSDRWLHSSAMLPISFQHLILPEKFPPHTELLDRQPLPLNELQNQTYEALYSEGAGMVKGITKFNPIQTQTFPSLYQSGANVMVAAPTGSGKTICAEFGVLRLFSQDPDATVVYVAPKEDVAKERFEDWDLKFGEGLQKNVVELTGETSADLKLLQKAHVVVSTPEQWDRLSRRWKQRKAVQNVKLFIVDDLHLIGGDVGPTLEVITSRMRYISAQQEKEQQCRIIGLSASVANAHDLGEWISAPSKHVYNFHPQARPIPLELRIQGFDIQHAGSRLLAMSRPAYNSVTNLAAKEGKPSIVFVPSRKQCQLTAIDIRSFSAAERRSDKFLLSGNSEHVNKIADSLPQDSALPDCVRHGIAFIHEGMRAEDRETVQQLWRDGHIGVVVATGSSAWGMRLTAHLVVVLDTQTYDGREHRYVDYPIPDMLKMISRASRDDSEDSGGSSSCRCVILCHTSKKQHLRKFLTDPLPVESHLDQFLHDHINAEVVTQTIENKQDAVDWITWTFFYRRLTQNPNYYNLQGVTNRHLSDHLSDLIEATLSDLEASRCIAVEDEMDTKPLNLGMIAAYYYIRYTTIEVFASSIGSKTKLKGLLEILSHASEYSEIPVRHGEENLLRNFAAHLPVSIMRIDSYTDPHVKANILLQAHFSRKPLPTDMRGDQSQVLTSAISLLQALVDVVASSGWLKPAIAAMELSQMVVQGLWANKDSVLLQIPHFTRELAEKCEAYRPQEKTEADEEGEGVETVYDLMELDDDERNKLLNLPSHKMADVARFCNRYPNIELEFDVPDAEQATTGNPVTVNIKLSREEQTEGLEEGAGLGAVHAPLFPRQKTESWWLAIGEPNSNRLLAIKRFTLGKELFTKLQFEGPEPAGGHELQLYFMSDSYLGCDQEYEFSLQVAQGEESSSEEEDAEMEQ